MIRSLSFRIRLATSSKRASAPLLAERVERERLVLAERLALLVLRLRVPLELLRVPVEPLLLRLEPLRALELRVLRFAPPEPDRPLEPDLFDPPLLAWGMLPPWMDWISVPPYLSLTEAACRTPIRLL